MLAEMQAEMIPRDFPAPDPDNAGVGILASSHHLIV